MITEIEVENYKSLHKLKLEVGRFNVLIGENGCGKSNILEAITLAGAAEANKLDNEFLTSRGVRVTEPELMRSLFQKSNKNKPIKIVLISKSLDIKKNYILQNNNQPYAKWQQLGRIERHHDGRYLEQAIEVLLHKSGQLKKTDIQDRNEAARTKFQEKIESRKNKLEIKNKNLDKMAFELGQEFMLKPLFNVQDEKKGSFFLDDFITYSPENTALRNFYSESQIEPLGINGEGLLKLLRVIQFDSKKEKNDSAQLDEIYESLNLFDWYEELKIPDALSNPENKLNIKDRYLETFFDQRSANEGFLFVLFYIALMVSEDTPKIFAIDNIDASLNPKLCRKLVTELIRLAKKYDKQVFVTTHNPAILDGIDLADDEQRLIVVSRNRQGHTRCKRIGLENKPKSSIRERLARVLDESETYTQEEILNKFDNSEEPVKLSEAFLRGYLGGLPKGF